MADTTPNTPQPSATPAPTSTAQNASDWVKNNTLFVHTNPQLAADAISNATATNNFYNADAIAANAVPVNITKAVQDNIATHNSQSWWQHALGDVKQWGADAVGFIPGANTISNWANKPLQEVQKDYKFISSVYEKHNPLEAVLATLPIVAGRVIGGIIGGAAGAAGGAETGAEIGVIGGAAVPGAGETGVSEVLGGGAEAVAGAVASTPEIIAGAERGSAMGGEIASKAVPIATRVAQTILKRLGATVGGFISRDILGHTVPDFQNSLNDSNNPKFEADFGTQVAHGLAKVPGFQSLNTTTNGAGQIVSGVLDGAFDFKADPLLNLGKLKTAIKEGGFIAEAKEADGVTPKLNPDTGKPIVAPSMRIAAASDNVNSFILAHTGKLIDSSQLDSLYSAPTATSALGKAGQTVVRAVNPMVNATFSRAVDKIASLDNAAEIKQRFPMFTDKMSGELAKADTPGKVLSVMGQSLYSSEYAGKGGYLTSLALPQLSLGRNFAGDLLSNIRKNSQATTLADTANFLVPKRVAVVDPSGKNFLFDSNGDRVYKFVKPALAGGGFMNALAGKVRTFTTMKAMAFDPKLLKYSTKNINFSDADASNAVMQVLSSSMPYKVALEHTAQIMAETNPEKQLSLFHKAQMETLNAAGLPADTAMMNRILAEGKRASLNEAQKTGIWGYFKGNVIGQTMMKALPGSVDPDRQVPHLASTGLFEHHAAGTAMLDYKKIRQAMRATKVYGTLYNKVDDGFSHFTNLIFAPLTLLNTAFGARVAFGEAMHQVIRRGVGDYLQSRIATTAASRAFDKDMVVKRAEAKANAEAAQFNLRTGKPEDVLPKEDITPGDHAHIASAVAMQLTESELDKLKEIANGWAAPKEGLEATYPNGKTFFHGTSRPIPDGKLKPDVYGAANNNLFGDGFYTTDEPEVASSYTKKGDGKEPSLYSVKWNGSGQPKEINLEETANKDLREIFKNIADNSYEGYSYLEEALENNKSTGVDLYQALRSDLKENGAHAGEAAEVFQDITTMLLEKQYDVIRHVGGKFTQSAKMLHNVAIWLKPEDISVNRLGKMPDDTMKTNEIVTRANDMEKQSKSIVKRAIQLGTDPEKLKDVWDDINPSQYKTRINPVGAAALKGYKIYPYSLQHKIDVLTEKWISQGWKGADAGIDATHSSRANVAMEELVHGTVQRRGSGVKPGEEIAGLGKDDPHFKKYLAVNLTQMAHSEIARSIAKDFLKQKTKADLDGISLDDQWSKVGEKHLANVKDPSKFTRARGVIRALDYGVPESVAANQVNAIRGLVEGHDGTLHTPFLRRIANQQETYAEDLKNIPNESLPLMVTGRKFAPSVMNVLQKIEDFGFRTAVNPIMNWVSRDPLYAHFYYENYIKFEPMIATGRIDKETAQSIASLNAVKEMTPLIHSPQIRSQFAMMHRNVMPFFFAQEQAMKRAGRLILSNPQALRDIQLIHQGLNNPAFVHTNSNGQKYIVYPMIGEAGNTFVRAMNNMGISVFNQRFDNLPNNALGSISSLQTVMPDVKIPAVGPFVSILAQDLADHFPWMQHAVNTARGGYPATSWLDTVMPNSSVRDIFTALTADEKEQLVHNAQIASLMSAYQTGDLNLGGLNFAQLPVADQQALLDRAEANAKSNLFVKGLLSFFLPLSPTVNNDYMTKDEISLRQEYTKMINPTSEGGLGLTHAEAWQKFAAEHGSQSVAYTAMTTQNGFGSARVPLNDQTVQWLTDHQDWMKQYPAAAAYLIPQGQNGKDALQVEQKLLVQGLRSQSTPQQFLNNVYIQKGWNDIDPYYADYKAALASVPEGSMMASYYIKQWDAFTKSYGTSNPIWYEDYNSKVRGTSAQNALTQLNEMRDKGLLNSPQYSKVNTLLDWTNNFVSTINQEIINGKKTRAYSIHVNQFLNTMTNIANEDPSVASIINGVFKRVA